MNRKRSAGVSVGGSSILMIFVLLALTTFATLSMVSANADYKLTSKLVDTSQAYYKADSAAEEKLAVIDRCLAQALSASIDRESYFVGGMDLIQEQLGEIEFATDGDGLQIRYSVPLDDIQMLKAEVSVIYPARRGEPRYTITSWSTALTDEWEPADEGLDVWDGGEFNLAGMPPLG